MSRLPLPPLARLLPKIQAPGPIEHLVGVPLTDWPNTARTEPWRWIAGTTRPRANWVITRGVSYLQRVPAKPSFKISGRRVIVHRLVYSIFIGPPDGLRYHARPTDFFDVNPAHWRPYERRSGHAPVDREVEVFDEELAFVTETLEERAALGRPLLENLIFTREQVEKALALTGLRADTTNYQPVE